MEFILLWSHYLLWLYYSCFHCATCWSE